MVEHGVTSRFITVDGLRSHLLEAGSGPPVVMLHSGEHGASAETSWGHLMRPLADAGYHVLAPDWLGFGRTDKVVDFVDPRGRRLRHMASVVASLRLGRPAFIGNSMGGTYLAIALAEKPPLLPAKAAVLVSGGGFVPNNEARQSIMSYDRTPQAMARILRAVTHTPRLADDESYVAWRHALSLEPGAWECIESARLRPPGSPKSGEFGKPDAIPYEQIFVPTLVIAGEQDKLRMPGYADEIATRIPDCELRVYEDSGHMPNLEEPERFLSDVVSYLNRRYRDR